MLANPDRVAMEVVAESIAPPPPIDYESWAVENIVFSARESELPGPYNPEMFPHLSEIFKALSPDDPCRFVTLKKSAQSSGTVIAQVFALGSLDLDPCDFLYVHPSEDNGRRWSRMKLMPMLKGIPRLRKAFASKSRDGGDSVFYKERIDGRGAIQISGANSPTSLSMMTAQRQAQDDLAKWEMNSGGDPESQANSRSRGREFAKILKIGTPLVMPGCRVTKSYKAGSQEQLWVPCVYCGHMHLLEWGNMLANLDPEYPEKAHFTCPDCGGVLEEHHRLQMLRGGKWIAQNKSVARHHRSFEFWSAHSILQSFETIAREWLAAEGDAASEQTFANDTVGAAYETKGESPPWEELRDRAAASDYVRGNVPIGAMLLTLGIDCQKDRCEWQLVGWGRDYRRWVIEAGIVPGHISDEEAQSGLSDLIKSKWRSELGHIFTIDRAAIDGNAWTEDVWDWSRKIPASKLIMVRGIRGEAVPLIKKVKKEINRRTGKLLKYSSRFYNFGAAPMKLSLYKNVSKTDPAQRGYVGLPRGFEDEWFQQFTAERRVPHKRKDGFIAYQWEKDPQQANEALDTHLQAEAAAVKLGVRSMTDTTWDRLEDEKNVPAPDAQLDLEDMSVAAQMAAKKPAKKTPAKPQRSLGDINRNG